MGAPRLLASGDGRALPRAFRPPPDGLLAPSSNRISVAAGSGPGGGPGAAPTTEGAGALGTGELAALGTGHGVSGTVPGAGLGGCGAAGGSGEAGTAAVGGVAGSAGLGGSAAADGTCPAAASRSHSARCSAVSVPRNWLRLAAGAGAGARGERPRREEEAARPRLLGVPPPAPPDEPTWNDAASMFSFSDMQRSRRGRGMWPCLARVRTHSLYFLQACIYFLRAYAVAWWTPPRPTYQTAASQALPT